MFPSTFHSQYKNREDLLSLAPLRKSNFPAALVSWLQLYVEKARVDETAFGWLKGGLLDVGDIVGAKGTLKRTDKGQDHDSASQPT